MQLKISIIWLSRQTTPPLPPSTPLSDKGPPCGGLGETPNYHPHGTYALQNGEIRSFKEILAKNCLFFDVCNI